MSLFDPSFFQNFAGNIPQQDNPPFTRADFFSFYPQFNGNINNAIVDQFIEMATNSVLEVRWHSNWKYGMCLFIAHFSSLYMRSLGGPDPTASAVMDAARTRGLVTSEAAGDLSIGYDNSLIAGDLKGWANWKSTSFGVQFATMARMLGKAGMYFV